MVERYMHEIDRRHIAALLTGHVGLIETPEGVQPLPMPAGDAHLHDQFSQFAAGMSSGVRLRMITDSIHLRLSVAQRPGWSGYDGAMGSGIAGHWPVIYWRKARGFSRRISSELPLAVPCGAAVHAKAFLESRRGF
jgi:hypothetical protein